MNDRQRFLNHMTYQPVDRCPIMDFGFWPETVEAWWDQGLPHGVSSDRAGAAASVYFGMDPYPTRIGPSGGLCPRFDEVVLEDRGDEEVVQQGDGVRVRRHKRMSSIPVHEGHLLTDRASWEKHYKPRLDPAAVARRHDGLDAQLALARDPDRAVATAFNGGSLFGWIRDWMGMEAVSYLVYDDPAWFEEMVLTLADVAVAGLESLREQGGQLDAGMFWEDMCFASGPLLAPEMFERYLVPQYRRITTLMRELGAKVIWVDCDGLIDPLIPLWLEGGVNCMFPIEVGTWRADPVAMRAEYGPDLLMMGGFDKRLLAKGPTAIEAEVDRLTPLIEQGGYIGFCDHRVPPDVPLEHYRHYLKTVRSRWGRDAASLRALGDEGFKC